FIDRFFSRRQWMLAMQALLMLVASALTLLSPFPGLVPVMFVIFFVGSVFAATNDVATDGYYMEALSEERQARWVGLRVLAYRIAMMAGTGVVATVGAVASWPLAFLLAAVIMGAFFLYHLFFLPLPPVRPPVAATATRTPYFEAFLTYLRRPRIVAILLFIVFLRAGEYMLHAMVSPFFVSIGIAAHYGWISSFVGLPATIAGALAGGWLIARFGLRRMLWPLVLFQNLTNLLYTGLAYRLQGAEYGELSRVIAAATVNGVENLSSGMGNAVLVVFLMRLCRDDFRAAHYAIGSGLMGLAGIFAGSVSGFIVRDHGYALMFLASFLAAAPALLSIPRLPIPTEFDKRPADT
ncbi:MAG TPA: MFS transporter, partial [bacterium]|nr:MFS transporter [bacterium]